MGGVKTGRLKKAQLWLAVIAAVLLMVYVFNAAAENENALVSNVFDNTYIVDALRDVSAQTGAVIIPDTTVQGQVTLTLENVPLEEALTRILAPGGYVFKKVGFFYLVGAPDPGNPSFVLLSETETIKLRYVKAETAAKVLSESFTPYVKVDKDNNVLVVTAPDNILKRIKADLAVIDKAVPQIMIEAIVVDISKNGRKDLGLDLAWDHNLAGNVTPHGPGEAGTIRIGDLQATLGYLSKNRLNSFLATLKAVVEKGEAKIQANPRVATLDGQAAEIFVGKESYHYLTAENDRYDYDYSSRLESIKTGIVLKMLPQIAENGEITVKIEPEVSDVVEDKTANGELPVINRRRVSTTVRVKDGESIVLGGLLQRTEHKVVSKVPILGDIPLLGAVFRKTKTVKQEGEVLTIITPHIMEEGKVLNQDGPAMKAALANKGVQATKKEEPTAPAGELITPPQPAVDQEATSAPARAVAAGNPAEILVAIDETSTEIGEEEEKHLTVPGNLREQPDRPEERSSEQPLNIIKEIR